MTRPRYPIRTDSRFQRQGRSFSLLSAPVDPTVRIARVVLIVLPPGPEQARCYRLLRGFAVTLASHGLAVMRLELSGTGNSNQPTSKTRLSDWHDDVSEAVTVLRSRWPDVQLHGVGVRYGARLLLDSQELDGLVCLSPLFSGTEWLDNLRQVQKAMLSVGQKIDATELAGQAWSVAMQADLRAQNRLSDLTTLTYSPKFILETDSRIENISQYKQHVIDLSSKEWISDSLPMLASAEVSAALLYELLDGLTANTGRLVESVASPRAAPARPEEPFRLGSSQPAGLLTSPSPGNAGFDPGLFGVYRSGKAACPVVVMLNSGLLNSTGPYGLYVEIAEHLSLQGVASVRLDFSGKGESARKPLSGSDSVLDDYAQLTDFLRSKGHQHTILLGICSGADDALELAHLTDNVAGLVLLDGYAPKTRGYTLQYMRERLTSLSRITRWLGRKARNALSRAQTTVGIASIESATDQRAQTNPQEELIELRRWDAPEGMQARYLDVLDRQCATLAVFTGGLRDDYYNHADQLSRALGWPAGLTEHYGPHMDHLYPSSAQRTELTGLVTHWLTANFGVRTANQNGVHDV